MLVFVDLCVVVFVGAAVYLVGLLGVEGAGEM